jgi:serine protease Do
MVCLRGVNMSLRLASDRMSARSLASRLVHGCLVTLGVAVGGGIGYFAMAQMPATGVAMGPLTPSSVLTGQRRDALVDIVEKVKSAVVNIHSERTVTSASDDPFRSATLQPQRVRGMGTGIVLDPRGYVVTNYHVIDEIQLLKVALVDGRNIPARVIATDKKADLALIKIDLPTALPIVSLGTAGDLLDAEQVIAIGNAFGYEHTVSIGHVAYKSRDVTLNKEISYQGLIQTTAPINPGNSGGPLFNKKGELVGVNVAIRAGAQNIAFAIPVDTMIGRAADMLSATRRGAMKHGIIAKDKVERDSEESRVRRWVVVEACEFGSAAATAGVRAGDVIEQVGDVETTTSIDIERGLLERAGGNKVPLKIRRGRELMTVDLLTETADVRSSAHQHDVVLRRMGMKLLPVGKTATAAIDTQLRGGMIVTDVVFGSAASKAGLVKGDILIGLHLWEALTLDNVSFVLNHKDLATFSPVKTYYVRDAKLRETVLVPTE